MTRCCRECKYAEWDADGCTCMIDGRSVYNASDYTCDQYRPAKPLTNGDKIRQMTDEELAKHIMFKCSDCEYCSTCYEYDTEATCQDGFLKWLRKEAASDENR